MTVPSHRDSPHRAWLVDLDGTLYAPRLVKLGMAAELALGGARHVAKLKTFRHEHEKLRERFRDDPELALALSPFEEQLRRTAELVGTEPRDLRRTINAWMFERPGKWLRLTRRKKLLLEIGAFHMSGGKTALVSDYPAQTKLEALGCRQLFDVVVANGEHPELRHLKPRPEGYLLAARELGVAPSDCLVLGDRDDADGAAARAAGMDFRLIR